MHCALLWIWTGEIVNILIVTAADSDAEAPSVKLDETPLLDAYFFSFGFAPQLMRPRNNG